MKNLLTFCCALALATGITARADDNKPITHKGASNLMFSFGGLSTLAAGAIAADSAGGTYRGAVALPVYSVGYRYFLADELALRASLGLIMSNTTTKGKSGFTDQTDSRTGFAISAGVEKHMEATSALTAHMGGQIGYLMGSAKITKSQPTGSQESSTKDAGSDLSIAAFAGAEWFFHSAMSLAAEYQLGFVSSSSSATNASGGTETTKDGPSKTFIGTMAVSATLNVYLNR